MEPGSIIGVSVGEGVREARERWHNCRKMEAEAVKAVESGKASLEGLEAALAMAKKGVELANRELTRCQEMSVRARLDYNSRRSGAGRDWGCREVMTMTPLLGESWGDEVEELDCNGNSKKPGGVSGEVGDDGDGAVGNDDAGVASGVSGVTGFSPNVEELGVDGAGVASGASGAVGLSPEVEECSHGQSGSGEKGCCRGNVAGAKARAGAMAPDLNIPGPQGRIAVVAGSPRHDTRERLDMDQAKCDRVIAFKEKALKFEKAAHFSDAEAACRQGRKEYEGLSQTQRGAVGEKIWRILTFILARVLARSWNRELIDLVKEFPREESRLWSSLERYSYRLYKAR